MDSMGQGFRTSDDLGLRNSLPRRFQPDTPEKQLDAVPKLSCGELSEAGHRSPESNLKREVTWQQRFPFSFDPTPERLYNVGKAPICEPIRGLSVIRKLGWA